MSPSFSWGSVSVSYVVLDLHGTAVSNNDSSDDRKLLFLSWIDVQFFSEMKHTIDRPFPPTHSIWPEHMISSKRAQLWLACKHMWNDPCKHFWGLWRFFRWTRLALSNVTFAVQTWWKWVLLSEVWNKSCFWLRGMVVKLCGKFVS